MQAEEKLVKVKEGYVSLDTVRKKRLPLFLLKIFFLFFTSLPSCCKVRPHTHLRLTHLHRLLDRTVWPELRVACTRVVLRLCSCGQTLIGTLRENEPPNEAQV